MSGRPSSPFGRGRPGTECHTIIGVNFWMKATLDPAVGNSNASASFTASNATDSSRQSKDWAR